MNSPIDVARAPAKGDDDEHDDREQRGVDEDRRDDPRQERDRVREPGDDRAEDEREQPGQEEDEDRVAERVEARSRR
jgi:hypothetical protein